MTAPDDFDAHIEIVPYNADWPAMFESERRALEDVLAPWLAGAIEHVGSTAVPQMAAKPVIDIMAPVETLDTSRPAIGAAAEAGYRYFPYKAKVMHWFCKPSPSHRTHHLHLVPVNGALWTRRLAFRDALRRDDALAAEYAALKRRLAEKYRHDREAYTQAKSTFILKILSDIGIEIIGEYGGVRSSAPEAGLR